MSRAQSGEEMRFEQKKGEPGDSDEYLTEYTPVLVMKSLISMPSTPNKIKIFLNVCSHKEIPKSKIIIGLNCPQTSKDKNGEDTLVYDVCVSCEQFASDESMEAICSSILTYMNSRLQQEEKGKIDMIYKLPKIKNQFKGSHTARFVSVSSL